MSKKKEYKLEFVIRSSPVILYNFVTTPSGMAQWFADHVDQTADDFSFFWEGFEEKAKRIDYVDGKMVKYRWEDADEGEFFQFEISKADITGDTILIVTDFAEEYEMDDQRRLWESQIATLSRMIGGG